jgi:aspartate racemase
LNPSLTASRNRIGIITGSGPEAGVDLWTKILQANKRLLKGRYSGDLDAPAVVIFSEPELGLSMELEANDPRVWACLERTARAMAPYMDYYAIACNTLNYYEGKLVALGLSCRLVSVADVVIDYIRVHDLKGVALLGARSVTDLGPWSPYRALTAHVTVELPNKPQALHELIYDVKAHGGGHEGIGERFADILLDLESEVVLLACTELPLIPVGPTGHRLVDVTDLLAHALAARSRLPRPLE